MKKFTSRKFLAMLAGAITGIAVICAGNVWEGAVTVLTSVITYICAEAGVDKAAVKKALEDVAEGIGDVAEKLEEEETKAIGFKEE